MKLTKQAIIFLVLSIVMLLSATFAWMNISKVGNVGGIDSNISDFTDLITFYVKRKGEVEFTSIETIEEMEDVFGNTKPGETYEFKVEFKNTTGSKRSFVVELKDIITKFQSELTEDFDLKDVFYIDNGKVNVSYYDINTNELKETLEPFIINKLSNDIVIKHEQLLNDFRLNNLASSNNNLIVSQLIDVDVNTLAVVKFVLVYDEATENILYQYNELRFSGIYIYGQ